MATFSRLLTGMLLALLLCPAAFAGRTRNVILVISDGVRWQEVFSGADPLLLNDKRVAEWAVIDELKAQYWNDDPALRRKLLFPFLWGTVAARGQLFGNRHAGSVARVTNLLSWSYPGYNEMASGLDDPRIDSNEFGPNPNVTVFEWLNTRREFAGKVEIFGTWEQFPDIFNQRRSKLPVRAGATLVDAGDRSPRGRLLRELYQGTVRLEGADPYDSFLHVALREHLKTHHPRVLFVGYGDTDSWSHLNRYDALLEAEHAFDAFLADLWQQVQSIPEYRNSTTLIVSTDHGRGSGPVEWQEHGVEEHTVERDSGSTPAGTRILLPANQGSENIWIAVIGPDTPPLGERQNVPAVTQAQIAATIAALLGQDFRAFKPAAAPSLLEALSH
jgi:hypothetical protein